MLRLRHNTIKPRTCRYNYMFYTTRHHPHHWVPRTDTPQRRNTTQIAEWVMFFESPHKHMQHIATPSNNNSTISWWLGEPICWPRVLPRIEPPQPAATPTWRYSVQFFTNCHLPAQQDARPQQFYPSNSCRIEYTQRQYAWRPTDTPNGQKISTLCTQGSVFLQFMNILFFNKSNW